MKIFCGSLRVLVFTVCAVGVPRLPAAQNVFAHYANGQVWVVWDVEPAVLTNCVPTLTPAMSNGVPVTLSNCLPLTYAIYRSTQPITNTTTAALVGRLFAQEWSASILADDVNASFGVRPTGFRIPDGAGGYRVLATNEGVFVHTVRSNFAGHYAVRPFGVTNVPAAWRAPLTNAFFSLAVPPTCHLQASGTNDGYPIEWWTMWADGDTNLAAARSDFPIMENDKRRGIPHNFSVTAPKVGLLPATNVPACIAFHSGDGQAKMWLPQNSGFNSIGLSPMGELLIAVEDRFFSTKNNAVDAESITGTGYVPTLDPFFNHQIGPVFASPTNMLPASNDVIIPYPLYRLNWTLDWLYAHKSVDSNRVSLVGHSGGAKGSLLWSHASPERFSAVGLYNPALGQFPSTVPHHVGTLAQNLPLLLTNHSGQLVRAVDIHQYAPSFSALRDLPLTRIFHGKREENWVLDDNRDALGDVAMTYRQLDALGLGAAVFWDLRKHGMDTWTYATLSNDVAHLNNCGTNPTVNISASWSIGDLWIPTLNTQIRRDDATNQVRHRADRSYPAFFNCALRGGHGDPGSVIYTNNSYFYQDNFPYDGLVTTTECLPPWTGDKRGTWGGYFDWESNLVDTPTNWTGVLFLVGTNSAFNPVEVCPDTNRVVDVAIRRPQQFKPLTGTPVNWELRNAVNNALLQSGATIVSADNLVTVTNLTIPRDPVRARLVISAPLPAPPCSATPTLFARLLTNAVLELRWVGCTNFAYQVEKTGNFLSWSLASPPLAAPPGGGWMTNVVSATNAYQFFRLHVLTFSNSPVPSIAGAYSLSTTHDGIPRHYLLNIPAGYNSAAPAPLALILHGHNQTAGGFAALHPELGTYANERGVILVIPDSTTDARGTGWNDIETTPENPVDDVSFLLALIEQLDTTLSIDRKRVYAGGFSNGGQMCHWLMGHTTNVFAAVAAVGSAVAGAQGGNVLVTNPAPTGPISALIVSTTNDCKRPFWGGPNDEGALQPPAFASVAFYTNADFCASLSAIHTNTFVTNNGLIGRFAACPSNGLGPMALVTNLVIREHYQFTCVPGTEVLFVTLTDGGHQWPNAGDNVGFNANREVLDFFLRHCNCAATGAAETLVVPTTPGQYDLRLCDQGYTRIFRLAIPASYNAASATPIVFTMHGGGQTVAEFAAMHPALFNKANSSGVILVLPEALVHPQSGDTLWMNKPYDYVVDDRAFFTNLLEHIAIKLNVNRKRVYACGFSSGGAFTHYLAITTTGLLAAIAPVCTQTGWNEPDNNGPIVAPPPPLESIAVMMVRGTNDSTRPFYGGINDDGNQCRSAAEDVAYWTAGDFCVLAPVNTATPYGANTRYPNCAGTTEVVLIRIDGMPHLWPDAADGFSYDANVSVIDFLLQHVRP